MAEQRLLLASSSRVHGSGFLDHLEPWLVDHLAGVDELLFVPWALADHDGYTGRVGERLAAWEIRVAGIHRAADPAGALEAARAIFVGGGNTFRLLRRLQDGDLLEPLRRAVRQGARYLGASAGSNLAGMTIRTTNDMPIVETRGLDALALVPFQINPHYLDPDPRTTHMGESRDTRLAEFHEENETPVVALREGALLMVRGSAVTLEGAAGGKLFRRGEEPLELAPGTRVDAELGER